jgi:uncharacterized protein
MQTPAQPRIEIIDILRGFTLLGIILVHFTEQYYAGVHPEKFSNFNVKFLGDEITLGFIGIFISGKFYMIFSFLFGLSFFLQSNKSEPRSTFLFRFFWRLIILLAIGFIHHLHYRGDILTIFAMVGVGLLIFYKLPDKILLILALALIINLPSVAVRGIQALTQQQETTEQFFGGNDQANEAYFNIVKHGSYLELLRANYNEFDFKYRFQIDSGRIYITLGLFLLGLYAGRKNVFNKSDENLSSFKKYLKWSLWSLLGMVLFAAALFGGAELLQLKLPDIVQWTVGGLLYDLFNLSLAVIYASTIVILFQKEKWKARLMTFYEVGRMGLTTYLMQTFFGVLLFFGIGFGFLGEMGALACAAIGVMIFIVQIYFSRWWLARFRYGFFEWLWRSATYFKVQPFRKL